jgi:hypothetical protein
MPKAVTVERVTMPENPFRLVRVMFAEALSFAVRVIVPGLAVIEKLGPADAGTMIVTSTE